MGAFLTGSNAYGTPRGDSDFDLVLLLPWQDFKVLCRSTWDENYLDDGTTSDPVSIRIKHGAVDLIVTGHQAFFDAWNWANRLLKTEAMDKPITRERAVKVIKKCLADAGMKYEPKEIAAKNPQEEMLAE